MARRGLLIALCAGACGGGSEAPPIDAMIAADGPEPYADAEAPVDGLQPLSWVDIAVSGCTVYEPAGPTCRGEAPLALRFTALAPAPLSTYVWSFGNGSQDDTSAAPEHVYALPGMYSVSLTGGGPGGTASVTHEMLVIVEGASVGAHCVSHSTCASGLECICGVDEGCPPSLAGGLCTAACGGGSGDCPAPGVCVDLDPAGSGLATWQRDLCLRSCATDLDCAGGLICRELLGHSGEWVHACFAPDLLGDEGNPCFDAAGNPDGTLCAAGQCESLGARGMCAAPCGSCPSYAACAWFTALGPRCVAICATRACDRDPWLGCEAPDPVGDLGFTLDPPVDPEGYCAPRRCAMASECGSDGTCSDQGGALFCGP